MKKEPCNSRFCYIENSLSARLLPLTLEAFSSIVKSKTLAAACETLEAGLPCTSIIPCALWQGSSKGTSYLSADFAPSGFICFEVRPFDIRSVKTNVFPNALTDSVRAEARRLAQKCSLLCATKGSWWHEVVAAIYISCDGLKVQIIARAYPGVSIRESHAIFAACLKRRNYGCRTGLKDLFLVPPRENWTYINYTLLFDKQN